MSRENVEVVRRIYDAYTRGDFATRVLAPRSRNRVVYSAGFADLRLSRARRVTESLRQWVGTWEDYRFEVDEVIDVGDQVLVRARQRGRGKGSGLEME